MSFKSKINAYAKANHIAAQVVLQNYMIEKFLIRLSNSEYKYNFVIKGGVLVAAMTGLDVRSTMDLDTTVNNLPMSETQIIKIIKRICSIDINDDIVFEIKSISPIRKDDIYGGLCVRIDAIYNRIVTPISLDITTGDVITPSAVEYNIKGIFGENVKLFGYNIETLLAEKIETILSRGIYNTRAKDFYDVYLLATTQKYSKAGLSEALAATSIHRDSFNNLHNSQEILKAINNSTDLLLLWNKYRKSFSYAAKIEYSSIMDVLRKIMNNNNF